MARMRQRLGTASPQRVRLRLARLRLNQLHPVLPRPTRHHSCVHRRIMAPSISTCVTAHHWWNTPQQQQAWAGSAADDVIVVVVVAAAAAVVVIAAAAARRNDRHRGCSRGGDGR